MLVPLRTEGRRTVKITLALYSQTPVGVLGEGMEHMVEEANAGIDGNLLRLAGLGGVAVGAIEEASIGIGGKVSAI